MSICDKCIHDEVCGLEDNHEEAVTFCSDMIPKDIFDKIRAEIKDASHGKWYVGRLDGKSEEVLLMDEVLEIIDKYKAESEQVGNPDRLKEGD